MLSPESSPESAGDQPARRRVSPSTVTQHGLPTPSNSFSNNNAHGHAHDGEGDIVRQTPGPQANPLIALQPASAFRHKRNASQTEPEVDDNLPTSSNTLAVPRTLGRKRSRLSDDGADTPSTPATNLAWSLAASSIAAPSIPASSLNVGWPQQLPTPIISPAKPPFHLLQSILDVSDLSLRLAINLPIEQFIDLYAISKQFHWNVNSHVQGYIKAYAAHNAPDTAKVFKWTQYVKSTIYDPAVRPIGIRPGVPLRLKDLNRTIPALRWLQKIMHRETVVHRIVSLLACDRIRLPYGTAVVLKKIWFLLELPTCGQRVSILRDGKAWPEKHLLLATMFFHKLDLRFTDLEEGLGEPALRNLLLTQRSLVPMMRVLEGYYDRKDKYSEFVNLVLEAFYDENADAGIDGEDYEDDEYDSDEELDEIEDGIVFDLTDAERTAILADMPSLEGTNAQLVQQHPQAAETPYGDMTVAEFFEMQEDADFDSDSEGPDDNLVLNPGHADPRLNQPVQPDPDPNLILDTDSTRFGALGHEFWNRSRPKLYTPDYLILFEAFVRGLNLHQYVDDMIIWGNKDPRNMKAIPPIRRAWLEGEDNRKYEDVEAREADEIAAPTPLISLTEGEGMELDEVMDDDAMSGLEDDY
ncbi:hypothetical protein BU16DRAFT_525727 [Lophium mytilinum]|uniref:Uncharacterized protein n=1 Tax=Lophium mytilinum TaxID=390894 RepID=A0A6A6QXN8_9PEZI|nr:hypothetical protein BU16DRAFT_525727 [Lophium mytilinum]